MQTFHKNIIYKHIKAQNRINLRIFRLFGYLNFLSKTAQVRVSLIWSGSHYAIVQLSDSMGQLWEVPVTHHTPFSIRIKSIRVLKFKTAAI